MNTISLAEGHALAITSMRAKMGADRLFRLACSKFESAIQATPDNQQALSDYAKVLLDYAKAKPTPESFTYVQTAFEKYLMAKSYDKIFQLAEYLQSANYFINFDFDKFFDLTCKCYETVTESQSHNIDPQLYVRSLLSWADMLIKQANRSRNNEFYVLAGKKYVQGIEYHLKNNPGVCMTQFYPSLFNNNEIISCFTPEEISMIFEIFKNSPNFDEVRVNWCYKPKSVPYSLIVSILGHYPVRILSLKDCSFSRPQIREVILLANKSVRELDLSNSICDNTCIEKIAPKRNTILTSLNLSGCRKIGDKGIFFLPLPLSLPPSLLLFFFSIFFVYVFLPFSFLLPLPVFFRSTFPVVWIFKPSDFLFRP